MGLFAFLPREGIIPANFDAKPSHDDGTRTPASKASEKTPSSAKVHIQARLFPPIGSPQIFSGLKTQGINLCQSLADAGFGTSPWKKTLVDDLEWECASTLTPVTHQSSDEGTQSSVFIVFRGSRDGRITAFRMKLNLLNPLQDSLLLDRALQFLAVLQNFADLSLPRQVVDAVARRKPLLVKTYSATYRLAQEVSDERRLNLMVTYLDWPRYTGLFQGSELPEGRGLSFNTPLGIEQDRAGKEPLEPVSHLH
jgi:hypothetical protein